MAKITTIESPLVLDLAVNNGYHKVYGMQLDNNTRKLIISLENNGEPYIIPSGVTAKLQGHRPDNAAIFKDCQIINNQIHCILTSYELAVPGDCHLVITLYEGSPNLAESFDGNRLSSFIFKVAVPKNPLDENMIVNSKEFSVLTETILKAENALKKATEALDKANDMIEDVTDLTERNEELSNELNNQIVKVNDGLKDIANALDEVDKATDEANNAAKNANDAADDLRDLIDNGLNPILEDYEKKWFFGTTQELETALLNGKIKDGTKVLITDDF